MRDDIMQDNNQMVLTVIAGFEGGLIIYDGSRLVFGGNIEEASRYITARMDKLLSEPPKPSIDLTLDDLLRDDGVKAPAQLSDDPAKMVEPSNALRRAMDAVERAEDGE